MHNREYIAVMIQSLQKKKRVLELIISKNNAQRAMFENDELEAEQLEDNLNEKEELIQQLVALDEGFQNVFEHISEELRDNREDYTAEIQQLQQLIQDITERSNTVQIQEKRNYDLAIRQFTSVRKQIKKDRTSSRQVNQYYRNMMNLNNVDAQYIDNKK